MTLDSDKTTIARIAAIARKLETISGQPAPAALERDFSLPAQLKRIENALTGGALTAHALDDHTNVVILTPTAGDVLEFDGSDWVNATPAVLKRYITFAINDPANILDHAERGTKSFCVFLNLAATAFTITKITGISDTDNFTSTFYISASTTDISAGNATTVGVLACSDDGTDGYTGELTAFTDDTIASGQWLIWEYTSGSANSFSATIEGHFED